MNNDDPSLTSNSGLKHLEESCEEIKHSSPEKGNKSSSKRSQKGKFSLAVRLRTGRKHCLYITFDSFRTNLNFKLDNYVQSVELDIPLVYLGKTYREDMKELLDEHISETIWFSYREKIPRLMPETFPKKSITCDRGWGCMIRCGQMMLAEGIKRHYMAKAKFLKEVRQESLLQIISLFADFVKEGVIAPFSMQQICSVAYELFGSKPGEWYRASTVMMSLDVLNEKFGKRRINDFSLSIFKEGTLYEDQLIEKMFKSIDCQSQKLENKNSATNSKQNEIKLDNVKEIEKENEEKKEDNMEDGNQDSQINQQDIHKEQEIEGKENKDAEIKRKIGDKWDNSTLLFIATKTGLSQHNSLYLPTVIRLLTFPQSIGILGGKDTKGYYFLGFQHDMLLYLDPHYVQTAYQNFSDMEEKFHSHFRDKFFQVELEEIDTSIGFGFYITDEKDYADFKRRLLKAINEDPNFLIGFQEVTPVVEIKHGDIIELSGIGDEIFEIIT